MPKGGMLRIGLLSMIVPHGMLQAVTRVFGRTMKLAGAAPKLHWSIAPNVTSGVDMRSSSFAHVVPVFLELAADAVEQVMGMDHRRLALDRHQARIAQHVDDRPAGQLVFVGQLG